MALLVNDVCRTDGTFIRTLKIARPERRNALDAEHLRLLATALEEAACTPAVRVVVITGEGGAFCSGYDLGTPLTPQHDADPGAAPDELVVRTMALVRACPLPIVARVNGPAFGAGLELAVSCDLRVASTNASFCLPPARLGIAYSSEGLARLASLVGTASARRMTFTAQVLQAHEARRLGLVDELVEPDFLDDAVDALAGRIAEAAPLAVRAMKRTLNALEPKLTEAQRAAAEEARHACYASDDAAEGLRAFREKRPPRFTGR